MALYKEKVVDIASGEESWRDYSKEEIAEVEDAIAEIDANAEALKAKELAKTELLQKLGITDDEARLLFS
jgi:hypothetical protein